MNRILVKLICAFIPSAELRRRVRTKLKEKPYIKNKYYGKIYIPYTNNIIFRKKEEYDYGNNNVYNKYGEKLEVFFLRDFTGVHNPYDYHKYIMFDRFNIGLDKHFYSNGTMLETMGNPKERYGFFNESESIIPEDFKIFDTHKGLEKDFDLIFTFSAKILDKIDNAIFIPFCSSVWDYNYETEELYVKLPINSYGGG